MTRHVTSADGTQIAYDRLGGGPPVVLVSGLFCDRRTTSRLAETLAESFTVYNYDRRGRGDSGDTAPYAVAREVEDLAALIAEAGGSASVYGHSSGAGLALQAAARGVPITGLVLPSPPTGPTTRTAGAAPGSWPRASGPPSPRIAGPTPSPCSSPPRGCRRRWRRR